MENDLNLHLIRVQQAEVNSLPSGMTRSLSSTPQLMKGRQIFHRVGDLLMPVGRDQCLEDLRRKQILIEVTRSNQHLSQSKGE